MSTHTPLFAYKGYLLVSSLYRYLPIYIYPFSLNHITDFNIMMHRKFLHFLLILFNIIFSYSPLHPTPIPLLPRYLLLPSFRPSPFPLSPPHPLLMRSNPRACGHHPLTLPRWCQISFFLTCIDSGIITRLDLGVYGIVRFVWVCFTGKINVEVFNFLLYIFGIYGDIFLHTSLGSSL